MRVWHPVSKGALYCMHNRGRLVMTQVCDLQAANTLSAALICSSIYSRSWFLEKKMDFSLKKKEANKRTVFSVS